MFAFFFLNLLLVENSWKEMLRHCISCEKNEVHQTKSHQKNIKNLQNSVKRPWVEAFLYYLNFELDKTAEMNKFNLNYLLSIYNDCKMQVI